MTATTNPAAASSPRTKRRYFYAGTMFLGVALLVAVMTAMARNDPSRYPNLSQNASGVTCARAHEVSNAFARAVENATKATPNYSGVKAFGFQAPLNPADIAALRATLEARRSEVNAKAKAAAEGTCTDNPTAAITDADGKSKVLPLVDGSQPLTPLSGSESNADSRTVPVTVGTDGDKTRTNSWSELDKLYGRQEWFTKCANTHLGMDWNNDVPKFVATEGQHDNRFILAVNTTLSDEQIRQRAADDGNPNVSNLPIVRAPSIINTRHLALKSCDEFIDTRSMIRVSLGTVVLDDRGQFKEMKTDEGIFVDCHNMWRLPKSQPVPTSPSPSTTPSGTPPGTPGTPTATPPTTNPPTKCIPPEVEGPNGTCVVPKDPNQGPVQQGNVPTQVQGVNPPAGNSPESRPPDPPATYVPPPPPVSNGDSGGSGGNTQPQPTRTNPPPVEQPAPPASAPATGCAPPPGMTEC